MSRTNRSDKKNNEFRNEKHNESGHLKQKSPSYERSGNTEVEVHISENTPEKDASRQKIINEIGIYAPEAILKRIKKIFMTSC